MAAAGLAATWVSAASATWSIIIVDTRTGEIGIASATCLRQFDLKQGASVVVVGKGAAAAQSYVDTSGRNRQLLFEQLGLGTDPDTILVLLDDQDTSHQTRQYGIVDLQGRTATFTGSSAGAWAGGMTGSVGDLVYSIQGNVLTGEPVVAAAVQAVHDTPGDLPERLMAAMEAAALMGGDGRCSCSNNDPTGCGSPPDQFNKSAHIGYMVVSRAGDVDGVCDVTDGCASGDYFMDFNIAFQSGASPDPVVQLRGLFDQWAMDAVGVPDAIVCETAFSDPMIPPDAMSQSTLTITLKDRYGSVLTDPYAVTVEFAEGSDEPVSIGAVTSMGGGMYGCVMTSTGPIGGRAVFDVTVQGGPRDVVLMPRPELTVQSLGFSFPAGLPEVVSPYGSDVVRFDIVEADGHVLDPASPELVVVDAMGERRVQAEHLKGLSYLATFPARDCGSSFEFHVRAATTTGVPATSPLNAPNTMYAAQTFGSIVTLYRDDLALDRGWTIDNSGADGGGWERAMPLADPESAHPPTTDSDGSGWALLTDNSPGASGVRGGSVFAVSLALDLGPPATGLAYDVFVVAALALGNDGLVVSAGSEQRGWTTIAEHLDFSLGGWTTDSFSVDELGVLGVDPTKPVQLRFEAREGDISSTVEIGVDNLRVLGPDCDPRACPADFDGDNRVTGVDVGRFFQFYAEHRPRADLTGDGVVDEGDVSVFLAALGEGCPS